MTDTPDNGCGKSVATESPLADPPGSSLSQPLPNGIPSDTAPPMAETRAVSLSRGSTRPLTPDEAMYTERFGAEVRRLRLAAEVGQAELARLTDISRTHMKALERGGRRTRRSTIERMAMWLIPLEEWDDANGPGDEQYDQLVNRLCDLLGPCLADERKYPRKPTRRRLPERCDACGKDEDGCTCAR